MVSLTLKLITLGSRESLLGQSPREGGSAARTTCTKTTKKSRANTAESPTMHRVPG